MTDRAAVIAAAADLPSFASTSYIRKERSPASACCVSISNSTSTARCSGTVSPSRTPARNAFATVKDPNPMSLAQIWIVLTR